MNTKLLLTVFTMLMATASFAQPPKPPSTAERLKHVTEKLEKELQLSADQKQKVLNAYKDFFEAAEKLHGNNPPPPPPPPPPVDKEEMDKLLKERDSKIKGILNEEQFKKFQSVEAKKRHPAPPPHDMPLPPQQL